MDGIRIEQRLWRGRKELEMRHMLEVAQRTGVLEHRNCPASHSRMYLSFPWSVVIQDLYE